MKASRIWQEAEHGTSLCAAGLANRLLFTETSTTTVDLPQDRSHAIVFIRPDGFKSVPTRTVIDRDRIRAKLQRGSRAEFGPPISPPLESTSRNRLVFTGGGRSCNGARKTNRSCFASLLNRSLRRDLSQLWSRRRTGFGNHSEHFCRARTMRVQSKADRERPQALAPRICSRTF